MRLLAWILLAAPLAAQVVEGRVINTATGNGVPNVSVGLLAMGQVDYRATTDLMGAFRMESVKDGSYTVFYSAPNFTPMEDGPARTFQVTAGAGPVQLQYEMAPVSRISGRVLDGDGNPVPNATVLVTQALQFGGIVFTATANEKGEFRSPQAMRPGEWLLSAMAPESWKPPEPHDGQRLGWATTFYPNVTDPALAVKVDVALGGEVPDLIIKLATAPVYRVRGVVQDVHGNPVPKASVTLDKSGFAILGGAFGLDRVQRNTDADGAFEFESAADGEYRLWTMVTQDGVKQWATHVAEVKGRDAEDVTLRLTMPFSIHGKVVMEVAEGEAPPRAPQVLVISDESKSGVVPSNPDGKGEFTVKNLYPGMYQISSGRAPAQYYLDSIRVGGVDVPEAGVQILSSAQTLTLTYKRNGGTVHGTIENCTNGWVFLVPQNPALRREGFLSQIKCGPDGRFEFTAVRPGEYYGFAVAANSLMPVSPMNPDQNLINQSARISVRPNESTDAEIRLIAR